MKIAPASGLRLMAFSARGVHRRSILLRRRSAFGGDFLFCCLSYVDCRKSVYVPFKFRITMVCVKKSDCGVLVDFMPTYTDTFTARIWDRLIGIGSDCSDPVYAGS